MSRLKEMFALSEMPRVKEEPIKAMLDWAAQQKGTFTARQLYNVYVANGGRASALGDNYGSFRTQLMKMVARPWKDPPKNTVSPDRPMLAVKRGSRGAGNPDVIKWALDRPLRTGDASFVNPDDDENSGAAMDRLEKLLSRMGKGLPADEKVGRQKLQAAIGRWKSMKTLQQIVVDIKGTIPKAGQMDALHIASEFLMDKGAVDQDDVEDAEDDVAPAPQQAGSQTSDDEDDYGEFSDDPHVDPDEWESLPNEPEEEPTAAPPVAPKAKAPADAGVAVRKKAAPAPTPEPEDDEEFLDVEPDDEDDVEPATKQQAGAGTFLKPWKPAAPAAPAKKKSPVSKWFKK